VSPDAHSIAYARVNNPQSPGSRWRRLYDEFIKYPHVKSATQSDKKQAEKGASVMYIKPSNSKFDKNTAKASTEVAIIKCVQPIVVFKFIKIKVCLLYI